MAIFNTNEIALYYECHGSGPPLMLIAGLASDGQSWMPVVEALSPYFTLILPDNRGAGRTRPPDAPISIVQMADDCAALADHLGHKSLFVAGHSMGGAIAMTLALKNPQKVDRLVLAAMAAKMSSRNKILFKDMSALRQNGVDMQLWYKMLFQWLFHPSFFGDEKRVNEATALSLAYAHAQSDENFARQLEAVGAVDFRATLHTLQTRTLVLLACDDLLFPLAGAKAMLADLPDAEFEIIDHAGHSLHWDNPDAFCAALKAFLLT
jgi:pimeloyl-ACP methyl ester carboxylesterase